MPVATTTLKMEAVPRKRKFCWFQIIHPLIYLFIYLFIHSFIHSFLSILSISLFIYLFIYLFMSIFLIHFVYIYNFHTILLPLNSNAEMIQLIEQEQMNLRNYLKEAQKVRGVTSYAFVFFF